MRQTPPDQTDQAWMLRCWPVQKIERSQCSRCQSSNSRGALLPPCGQSRSRAHARHKWPTEYARSCTCAWHSMPTARMCVSASSHMPTPARMQCPSVVFGGFGHRSLPLSSRANPCVSKQRAESHLLEFRRAFEPIAGGQHLIDNVQHGVVDGLLHCRSRWLAARG